MEMRGHEHDVEVVVFAPISAYAAIRELAGIPVSVHTFLARASDNLSSNPIAVSDMAYISLAVPGTRL
jgi:hypothetical protein